MKLELFYYDQCPFCQRVLNTIKTLGLEEKIQFKNTLTDQNNAAFHSQKTGRNSVPCLYIDDQPMFESGDIMNWLTQNVEKTKG
jgi:glutaredoxin 2